MDKVFKIVIFHLLLLGAVPVSLLSQKTSVYTHCSKTYNEAMDLYGKEKYNMARNLFDEIIHSGQFENTSLIVDADYYKTMCALRLFLDVADHEVYNFINQYPESSKKHQLNFELGRYYYQKKKYREAATSFEKADEYELSGEERAESYFKTGYSYFIINKLDTARVFLYYIKDIDTKYTSPAIYYYSHINYRQGNYQTALEGFQRLEEDASFAPIIPYYVAHILYIQGKDKEIIEYAPPLIDSVIDSRKQEMNKIIGDAYFRLKDYQNAIEYLEAYKETAKISSRMTKYEMGYSYYMIGNLEEAITWLELTAIGIDYLSQNAYYVLADCYIQAGRKEEAMQAFAAAAQMDYDKEIKKDALFNYAVLAYELAYSPFNNAVRAFTRYIDEYPYSERVQEAYNYLVQVYLSTNNYQEAIQFLDKIHYKDERIKKAYQRAAFFHGLELYTDLDIPGALEYLNKSLQYGGFDRVLEARAHYWKGEILYRNGEYEMAEQAYKKFMYLPATYNAPEYQQCHYNLGYTAYNQKDYDKSLMWFKKYRDFNPENKNLLADTYNRLGDLYFFQLKYDDAISFYDKNINIGVHGSDYALFQKAFCLGLKTDFNQKIKLLGKLVKDYPETAYKDDALFETGKAYESLNDPSKASGWYLEIINSHPTSSYVPKALVQMGLISYNNDQNDKALGYFKQVVENYPVSDEARNALKGMKNIYVEKGDVDPYYEYVDGLNAGFGNETSAEKDSTKYNAAVNVYMSGDCEKAIQKFENYLQEFENGSYELHARFYKSDCFYQNEKYPEALEGFSYIIEQPENIFTEQALIAAASINFAEKEYQKALELYGQLEETAEIKTNKHEARLGQMRCAYQLEKWDVAIEKAKGVLSNSQGIAELEREAGFVIAKSKYAQDKLDDALFAFELIAEEVNSKEGAESKYRIAEILHKQQKYEECKELIMEFAKTNTPHEYWLASAFILLADCFMQKGQDYQARATLNSVIENYSNDDDGIKEKAKEKLEQLEEKDDESVLEEIEIEIQDE